jgi:hypothetical protein
MAPVSVPKNSEEPDCVHHTTNATSELALLASSVHNAALRRHSSCATAYAPELNPVANIRENLHGNKFAVTVFESFDDIVDKSCALRGASSPTTPNASQQSHPELGRRSILEAIGVS